MLVFSEESCTQPVPACLYSLLLMSRLQFRFLQELIWQDKGLLCSPTTPLRPSSRGHLKRHDNTQPRENKVFCLFFLPSFCLRHSLEKVSSETMASASDYFVMLLSHSTQQPFDSHSSIKFFTQHGLHLVISPHLRGRQLNLKVWSERKRHLEVGMFLLWLTLTFIACTLFELVKSTEYSPRLCTCLVMFHSGYPWE